MEDAGSYYTNMVASSDWKLEVGKNAQIIALTTQISELKTAFNQTKIDKSTKPHGDDTPKQLCNPNDSFQMWHLTKVNNDKEFNMVEKEVLFTYVRYAYPRSLLLRSCLPHYLKLNYLVTQASSGHT